jgi:hypothetical protein
MVLVVVALGMIALLPLLYHTSIICLNINGDAALFERVILSMGNVYLSQTEEEIMLYVTLLKSYISYFHKFSRYMNSYVSGPTTYSHF